MRWNRSQYRYGITYFFGTDDNFLNDSNRALDIAEALAKKNKNR